MKINFHRMRLLAEVLCIIAAAELGEVLVLPFVAPLLGTVQSGLIDAIAVLLIAAPIIYWRFSVAVKWADAAPADSKIVDRTTYSAVTLAAVTLILGLALTVGGAWWQASNLQVLDEARFDVGTERTETEIIQRLNRTLYGLKGARGAIAANEHLRRKDFRAYVQSRDLTKEFPGVRGFGLIRRVQRADLEHYIGKQRADGVPDYTVKTDSVHPDLYVVEDIEPLESNFAALGFDLGQDPTQRVALERAVATGEPTLLAGVTLLQDAAASPGFIYFLPVYKPDTNPQTAEERIRDLQSLVYAPIVVRELLSSVANATDGDLDFELYDGTQALPEAAVFDTDGVLSATHNGSITAETANRTFWTDHYLNLGGREMLLRTSSTSRFDLGRDNTSLVLVAFGGLLVSLLLSVAAWLLAAGRQRAQEIAEAMTVELRQMALVVERTASAVTIMDRHLKIVWVNPGFSQITGYSKAEAIGRTPSELLTSDKTDPAAIKALVSAAGRGEGCRVQLVNRAKDGHEYWADTEVQPRFNAENQLIGFMEIGTDISDQKRLQHELESALRDANALLNAIHTHAIVSMADRSGKIIEVNDAFCRISGYTRDELIGQDHRLLNSGQQSKEFWADLWDTVASGKPWRGDICNRAKDGSLYWVDSMIAPYVDSNGFVEKYVSIRTDITSRRNADEKLRRSEATFFASFESAASGVAFLTPTGQWMRANPAMCKLMGRSEKELQELTFRDVTHPDEWALDAQQMQRLLTGEIPFYQRTKRYVRADGNVIWGIVSVSCVRESDGSPQFVITQIVDITGRKRAEEALSLSNALLEESQSVAKVGGWELNVETGNLYLTLETYRIYETTPEEFSPTVESAVTYMLPDSRERLQSAMQLALKNATGYDLELETLTLKGNRKDIRMTCKVASNGDKAVRLSGIFQDITERKQYERALDEARQAAELATLTKGQFLANMSHEIRTPMNSIIGMTRMVLDSELTLGQRDYLQKAHNSANSLLHILNDILDYSKIKAGQLQLERLPFDLLSSVTNVAEMFELQLQKKSLAWNLSIAADVPNRLIGDALRLEQVLINLVSNAIKFTSIGSVEMRVGVAHTNHNDVWLQFVVKDSGIGIDGQQLSQLFSPFTQADSSITRKYGGTGLGLSISRQLVEQMGGTITVQSEPSVGSSFTFTAQFALDAEVPMDDRSPMGADNRPLRAEPLDDEDTAAQRLKDESTEDSQPEPVLLPVDWVGIAPLLAELEQLLSARNLRAKKVAESLSTTLLHTEASSAFQVVLEAAQRLEFEAAFSALKSLHAQGIFPE